MNASERHARGPLPLPIPLLAALLVLAASACVEKPEGPPEIPLLPGGYRVALDGGRLDPGRFVTEETPDGIRVTTGPGGIAWRPQDTVSVGDFRAEASFTLMGAPIAYREGFGIFVGGKNLAGPSARFLYLMVRAKGEYLIQRRVGQATETIVDWLPHASVQRVDADGDTPTNALAIESVRGELRFLVNGTVVFRMPAAEAEPWGTVGLKLSHRVDLVLAHWTLGPPPEPPPDSIP